MRPITEETIPTQASPPPPAATTSAGTPCDTQIHDCRWWPYSNSNDFGANTAMIIVILLCALICALAFNAALRCFLRTSSSSSTRRSEPRRERKPTSETPPPPVVASSKTVYSAGMKLGDCAICLSEFVEGEGLRVLDVCKHGFHDRCIDTWLNGHSSCPTCRASCFAVVLPPPPESGGGVVGGERGDDDRESGGGPADVIN